jgi:hypothetical protein
MGEGGEGANPSLRSGNLVLSCRGWRGGYHHFQLITRSMYQCTRRAAFPQAMSIGCRRGVWSSKAAHTKQSLAGALGDHRQKAKSENTLERIHHLHHSIPLVWSQSPLLSIALP